MVQIICHKTCRLRILDSEQTNEVTSEILVLVIEARRIQNKGV